MSKTHSQSLQSEEYPVTEYRIRKRQKKAFHYHIARSINTGLRVVKVPNLPAPLARVIEFPKTHVTDEDPSARQLYLKNRRLELVHELGEQMLQASS